MFTGTSTVPIFMTANIASIHSGRLTIQSATGGPGRRAPRAVPHGGAARWGNEPMVCFA
jgi:hypothetical protein